MVLRIHFLNLRANPFPKITQGPYRFEGRALGGNKKSVSVVKQLGKASARARMFGPCQRVCWNKVHIFRKMRTDCINHSLFHRTHIANGRTRFEMRGNLLRHRAHRAHRHTEHNEIRVFHSLCRTVTNHITQADLPRDITRLA